MCNAPIDRSWPERVCPPRPAAMPPLSVGCGWREDRSGYLARDPVSPAIGSRMESRPSHALPPLAREQDTLARFSGSGEPQGLTISIYMLILVIPSNDIPTTTWGVPTPAPHLRRRTPRAR